MKIPVGQESSAADLIVVLMAREIVNGDFVILGVGTPMAGAALLLARATHAPLCDFFFNGAINPEIEDVSVSLLRPEEVYARTDGFLSHGDIINQQQRGRVSLEFIRPVQVDAAGSINLSRIGDGRKPKVRFPGSVAVPDSSVQFGRTILYVPQHDHRVFVERLDFRSAAGHLEEGAWRKQMGIIGGGPCKVITNLAVLGFDNEQKQMMLETVHTGVSVEHVEESTGFKLLHSPRLRQTLPPQPDELHVLSEEIDRHRIRDMEFKSMRSTVMDRLAQLSTTSQ